MFPCAACSIASSDCCCCEDMSQVEGQNDLKAACQSSFVPLSQVEAEGDVATAFTLARILSNIPLSRGGPTSVVIFDIHALQVIGLDASHRDSCFPGILPREDRIC